MRLVVRKAFVYITHQRRLLLFRHVGDPGAGIQVPAGTIRPGEAPAAAALREAREETGLEDLVLGAYLGEQIRAMADVGKDETHHRFFYHVAAGEAPPATWQHDELDASGLADERPRFAFFWATLPDDIPPLIADHGVLLPELIRLLDAHPAAR
jgi:ADP-ribose pyrophosphatase YjhB (NUDIX family)